MFSVVFAIAFGTDVAGYQTLAKSLLTLVRTIFGDFDYDSLAASNAVFGPLFFLLFILTIGVLLMNMFIAIVTELYTERQKAHEVSWEFATTLLMIDYNNQISWESRVIKFWQNINIRGFFRRFMNEKQQVEGDGWDTSMPISFNPSEILEMVTERVEGQSHKKELTFRLQDEKFVALEKSVEETKEQLRELKLILIALQEKGVKLQSSD